MFSLDVFELHIHTRTPEVSSEPASQLAALQDRSWYDLQLTESYIIVHIPLCLYHTTPLGPITRSAYNAQKS